jgi:hypothetical protein
LEAGLFFKSLHYLYLTTNLDQIRNTYSWSQRHKQNYGHAMIEDAENKGVLPANDFIIEPTSAIAGLFLQ